jgi:hypothetical protein
VKQFGPKAESAFEAVATLLLNWCKGWFELFPNPPLPLLRRFLVSGAPGAGARTAINVTKTVLYPMTFVQLVNWAYQLWHIRACLWGLCSGVHLYGCRTSLLCKLRMCMQLWLSMIFCDKCYACLWLCAGLCCAADAIQA